MSKKDKAPKAETVQETSLEGALGLTDEVTQETEIEETADEVVEEELETEEEETEVEEVEEVVETPKTEVVKDDNGTSMFRRMKPTRPDPTNTKKERMKPSYKPVTKQSKHKVSANAALISFPTDRYGVTKDIKTAMIRAASRIAGDQNKKDLVLEVIGILTQHIEHKFVADKEYRAALAARDEQNEQD